MTARDVKLLVVKQKKKNSADNESHYYHHSFRVGHIGASLSQGKKVRDDQERRFSSGQGPEKREATDNQ